MAAGDSQVTEYDPFWGESGAGAASGGAAGGGADAALSGGGGGGAAAASNFVSGGAAACRSGAAALGGGGAAAAPSGCGGRGAASAPRARRRYSSGSSGSSSDGSVDAGVQIGSAARTWWAALTCSGRLAVVGGREFRDESRAHDVLDDLHRARGITRIVSGGAPGADTYGANWASSNGVALTVYRPVWMTAGGYNRQAGFDRNSTIVADSTAVLAFWDGVSGGTRDTISKARGAGKPVHVELY